MLERINLVPGKPLSEQLKTIVPLIIITTLVLILIGIYLQNLLLTGRIEQTTRESAILQVNQEKANVDLANLRIVTVELEELQKKKISLQEDVGKIAAIRRQKRHYSQAINTIAMILADSLKCEKISFNDRNGMIEGLALNHRDLPQTVKKLQEMPGFVHAFLSDVEAVAEAPSAPLNFKIMFEIE